MFSDKIKTEIISIWDSYVASDKAVLDTKGKVINNIDESRLKAIQDIKEIVAKFLKGDLNVYEFKSSLDSYNKRNNLWGFTATKGQMFFNQLTKTNEHNIENLTTLLKNVVTEPKDLEDGLRKIDLMEKFVLEIFSKAKDKRKVPNPGSVGYFLSYFWQINNPQKWPVIYTSLITAYKELGIWQDHSTRGRDYEYFYKLNEEIKAILRFHTSKEITNWDAEHSFWNLTGKPVAPQKRPKSDTPIANKNVEKIAIKANFEITEYLIPKVAKLVELGNEPKESSPSKASQYERLVAEIFRQLDFEVDVLGQGKGRNPDAVIKHREENTAFLVDAKAYGSSYNLGIDDRAIREYISYHCPKLQKDWFYNCEQFVQIRLRWIHQ